MKPSSRPSLPAPSRRRSSYEDFLDRLRLFSQEQMFLIGARVLSDTVSAEQAGGAFARLADVAVRALHRRVEDTVAENHGRIRGQQTALLALGKLGGREMTATSDLDLIIVYDFDAGASAVRRRAAALRRAVFRPADPAADQRAVVADQLRRALSGRHAAAAVRPLRPGGHQSRRLRELPGHRSLDLGAHGADARARGLGSAGVRRPRRGGDPRRALPQARSGGGRRRRGRDAAGDRQGEGRGRALGPQICRRRAGRSGVHRAISAARSRGGEAGNPRHQHRARARQGVAAGAAVGGGGRRAAAGGAALSQPDADPAALPAGAVRSEDRGRGAARAALPRGRPAEFRHARCACRRDAAEGARELQSDSGRRRR